MYLGEKLYGSLSADYRWKRGFGGGPDVIYDAGTLGHGTVTYYYLRDLEPGFLIFTNGIPASSTNGAPIDKDRYRLGFTHQVGIDEYPVSGGSGGPHTVSGGLPTLGKRR